MISVAMCTYNGGKFLKEQLLSLLNQTYQPDEIIICDDGSHDDTIRIVSDTLRYWHGEWKIVKNERNLGFVKNFEKAINLCKGDLIFLCDQDDVWKSCKIERINKFFIEHPQTTLVFHDAEVVDENLISKEKSLWEINEFEPLILEKRDFRWFIWGGGIYGCTCAFKKELMKSACPFPIECGHDIWLSKVAMAVGNIAAYNEKLIYYRRGGGNASSFDNGFKSKVLKWISQFHKNKSLRHKYFQHQSVIIQKWFNDFEDELYSKSPELFRYRYFVQHREKYVCENSGCLFKIIPEYFSIYPSAVKALREIFKDVLTKKYL